jgi:hypothetical protein
MYRASQKYGYATQAAVVAPVGVHVVPAATSSPSGVL